MVIKERFQVDVVRFEVDGIKMIGNNRTGSLIGLTEEGSKMIDDIYSDGEAEITETTVPYMKH